MRELQDIVAARIELAGVSRRQLETACREVPKIEWQRLPLVTKATLDGEPLQRFLDVSTSLDIESFVSVYEEFVAGYLITTAIKAAPQSWLAKNLGLSVQDAAQLFGDGLSRPGRRPVKARGLLQMVVALADMARAAFNAKVIFDTPTRYVVHWSEGCRPIEEQGTHEVGIGFSFGVMEGRPLSNLRVKQGPRVAPLRCERGLVHSGRGSRIALEPSDASVWSQLQALNQASPGLLGEQDGMQLALNILRWRSRGHEPRRVNAAIVEGVDPVGFRQALRLAAGFREADNPYKQLQALLVPVYVSRERFIELFGHAPRGDLTHQRAQQWTLALDHLAEGINTDRY